MDVSLRIVYESEGAGKALTAAKVEDRQLLMAVAKAAITEAYQRADAVAVVDPFLGEVHQEEAARLEKVLGMLIPALQHSAQLRVVLGNKEVPKPPRQPVAIGPEEDDSKEAPLRKGQVN